MVGGVANRTVGPPQPPDIALLQCLSQPLPSALWPPQGGNRDVPSAHLLQRQLPEQRQRAGEQADKEGGRRAHDVDHGRRQHGDVGVLPGEGVDDGHHGVAALGQRAVAEGREGEKGQLQGKLWTGHAQAHGVGAASMEEAGEKCTPSIPKTGWSEKAARTYQVQRVPQS